jgi:hypothetical protein
MKTLKLSIKLKIILLILIFASSNCEDQYKSEKYVNDTPFTIKPNESIEINDNLRFLIDGVFDSRCPTGVFCFWAGNVELSFKINQNSSQIDTLISDLSSFNLAGYNWKIMDVSPYPVGNKKIGLSDYRITMLITQN